MHRKIKLLINILLLGSWFIYISACFTADANTIEEAFKGGKVSGTIGNYFEHRYADASDSDYGWSSAYLTIKYQTLTWNDLKFGARFFAHGELYSDHDDGTTDPFDADVESQFTLPELYLNYAFAGSSSVTVGRFKHKKVSHIDDNQSEGGYVSFKEIENLELIAGTMTRFAEIDYDDGEDFGRTNDAQDLDSEGTYGAGSPSYLMFLEAKYRLNDVVKFNPYFMYHNDYANVLALDTIFTSEWEKYNVEYGGSINYVHVNAEIAGSTDANIFAIMPFIQKGPVKINFSYSKYDDGTALNHPGWLADEYKLVDQDNAKNNSGADIFETKIKYSINDCLWTSFAYAAANYDAHSTEGDGYQDLEFQVGYKITDNLDINGRFYIVTFDNISDQDYNKFESRMRFKF